MTDLQTETCKRDQRCIFLFKKMTDLHVHKLYSPSISSRDNTQNIDATAVAEPSWTIFEDFGNLNRITHESNTINTISLSFLTLLTRNGRQKIQERLPSWVLNSRDRRLVLLPQLSCGKQQQCQ